MAAKTQRGKDEVSEDLQNSENENFDQFWFNQNLIQTIQIGPNACWH